MSGVPRQIQQQADEADKKAQEIVAAQNGQQPPAKVEDAPVVTPAPEPAPKPDEPTPTPEPTPAPVLQAEDWEHKYKTLNGMYKAEVKRAVDQATATTKVQLDAYQSQIQALQAQIQALMANPKPEGQPEPAAPARTAAGKRVWTEDFRKAQDLGEVGEGVAAVEDRAISAEEKADRALRAVAATQETAANLAMERCLGKLAEKVSDWEAVNDLPEFKAYCLELDPVFGVPRQQALASAEQSMDAVRLANFFNAFKSSGGAASGDVEPITPPTRPKLDVSPASSRGSSAKVGKTWRESEVQAFYTGATKNRMWQSQPAEYKRIDDEINAARAAGRVVAG